MHVMELAWKSYQKCDDKLTDEQIEQALKCYRKLYNDIVAINDPSFSLFANEIRSRGEALEACLSYRKLLAELELVKKVARGQI
jgi:hypothetical protein